MSDNEFPSTVDAAEEARLYALSIAGIDEPIRISNDGRRAFHDRCPCGGLWAGRYSNDGLSWSPTACCKCGRPHS
jgi:hypothetical protein